MATRVNAHEERLATLNSIMNVIAILDMGAPRRSVTDRWIDVRALMPVVDADQSVDESWDGFAARAVSAGPVNAQERAAVSEPHPEPRTLKY